MAISVIASQNKINISVADLTKFGNQYASYYGYTSYQQLIEKYGKQLNCEVGYNTLRAKTAEWFASNVKPQQTKKFNRKNQCLSGITLKGIFA